MLSSIATTYIVTNRDIQSKREEIKHHRDEVTSGCGRSASEATASLNARWGLKSLLKLSRKCVSRLEV
jgi:hypothetical protein